MSPGALRLDVRPLKQLKRKEAAVCGRYPIKAVGLKVCCRIPVCRLLHPIQTLDNNRWICMGRDTTTDVAVGSKICENAPRFKMMTQMMFFFLRFLNAVDGTQHNLSHQLFKKNANVLQQPSQC